MMENVKEVKEQSGYNIVLGWSPEFDGLMVETPGPTMIFNEAEALAIVKAIIQHVGRYNPKFFWGVTKVFLDILDQALEGNDG
jgi:hypothetical protein